MENNVIHHRPRHFDLTISRRVEIETEIVAGPDGVGETRCPDCGCVMMYRGLGRLRNGKLVHVFECVHSHREVHSVSILIAE